MSKIDLLEKISDGNLAEVWVGRATVAQKPVMVTVRRLLKQVAQADGVIEGLASASARSAAVSDEFLLPHLGFGKSGEDYYWADLRTEGFDLGTVLNRLSSREVRINSLRSLQIGWDFTRGLGKLHQEGITFGGLSPEYIIVGYDGKTRLSGAGFETTLLDVKELKQKTKRGRSGHLAPEVIQGRRVSVQSDVFAAAAIVYTLLTGVEPLAKDERAGMGMSVRHASVRPPSKLDRTLPFSCDAVFVKALNTSPKSRHDDGVSLSNAIKRLRAAMLKGPDKGHEEVRDFVVSLFPNEAHIAGMPGTLEGGQVEETIELDLAPAPETVDGGFPAAAVETETAPAASENGAEQQAAREEPVDEEAAARVAAWEAAMGGLDGKKPAEQAAKPPPLPAASRPPTAESGADAGSSSVVVDWDGVGDKPAAEGAVADARVQEEEKTPTDIQLSHREEPTLERESTPLEIDEHEETPTDDTAEVEPPGDKAHDTDQMPIVPGVPSEQEIKQEADTQVTRIPPQQEPGAPSEGKPAPLWKRPSGIVAGVLLILVLIAAVYGVSNFFSSGPEEEKPVEEVTHLGFLSVVSDAPAQLTLDGELLEGTTPLENRIIRAGKHRLVVQTLEGGRLLDEIVTIGPGEHKSIRVVVASVAPAEKPAKVEKAPAEQPKKLRRKKRRRRRKKTKRRRRKKTRKKR